MRSSQHDTQFCVSPLASSNPLVKLTCDSSDSDPATLYSTLQQIDPLMASRWHPNDHRKIRRSLAIYYTTGRRASDIYAEQAATAASSNASSASPYDNLIFWVHAANDPLRERLDTRVDKMLSAGMRAEIGEMRRIYDGALEKGEKLDVEHGIWQSIGFKEFLKWGCYTGQDSPDAHDSEGNKEKEREALREMKTATRQYAKYQIRWIRTKFWRLLKQPEDEGEKKLFVLDSTDVARYEENVVHPALDIAKRKASHSRLFNIGADASIGFLAREDLPDPQSLSSLAKESLIPSMDIDISKRRDLWGTRKCEVCDVVTTNQVEWEKHLSNNRHKKRVQGKKKMEEVREFLRKRELEKAKKETESDEIVENDKNS